MKYFLTFLLFGVINVVFSQPLYFPPTNSELWETLPAESLGWCSEKINPLFQYLENNNTKAFILLKNGKIVIEKYFGTFAADSIWNWASAGKSLTSFLIGILQQDQLLSIDNKTSTYLGKGWSSCNSEQEDKITIKHQLSMTTGLDDYVPDPFCTLKSCLRYKADAGSRWAYHNAPYTLLDKVIENATGNSLNNLIIQKLKNTTGITGLYLPSGFNNVFFSKPRSMARFGLLLLNKGNWNGVQILKDSVYFNQMVNTSQLLNPSYGYLWWLNGKSSFKLPSLQLNFQGSFNKHAPADMFAALGKNGQIVNVVPSQKLVYIRMGNTPYAGELPVTFNDTVWMKLNELICIPTVINNLKSIQRIFSIYPNPSRSECKISIPNQFFGIEIEDLNGNVVFTRKNCFEYLLIQTSNYSEGIYIVKIKTSENKTFTQKLVVFHSK